MVEMLKGTLLAQEIREKAKKNIKKMKTPPGMAVILVGDDPASMLYVNLKEKAAKEVGIYIEKFEFPKNVSERELTEKIGELNARDDIHGILVQLPLPLQDEDMVISAIDPKKDIDGFHIVNREKQQNDENCIFPPVALAVERLIEASLQPLFGKTAVIIGNSQIFANPLLKLMKRAQIEGAFLPRETGALSAKTRPADIIVVAVGQKNFLSADMIKEGAIIIDVGTNKDDHKIVGDVSPGAREKAGFVSPVPGGVGPLTVAYLLTNVIKAAKN